MTLATFWPVLSGRRPTSKTMPSVASPSLSWMERGFRVLGVGHSQPRRLPISRLAGMVSPIDMDTGRGRRLAVVARPITGGRTMNPGHRKIKIDHTVPWAVGCWPCDTLGHARPWASNGPFLTKDEPSPACLIPLL